MQLMWSFICSAAGITAHLDVQTQIVFVVVHVDLSTSHTSIWLVPAWWVRETRWWVICWLYLCSCLYYMSCWCFGQLSSCVVLACYFLLMVSKTKHTSNNTTMPIENNVIRVICCWVVSKWVQHPWCCEDGLRVCMHLPRIDNTQHVHALVC